ncbi:MAG TPA: hypothetical protein VD905_15520, partial [Flavobacteriales bacterium]|nr:hypothetical protein [Flavobacteriales bacterium]
TLAYQNVTNLQVTDKLITLNKGGGAASGVSSGFEIEEGGSIAGYFATNGTRNGYDFKAPAVTSVATLLLTSLTQNRTLTAPDVTGTIATVDGGQTFTNATWQSNVITTTYTQAKIKGSVAVNQIPVGTAADTIGGSAELTYITGVAELSYSTTGGSYFKATNVNTGTAAYSAFWLSNSANSAIIQKNSTGYSTSGMYSASALIVANTGNIALDASSGNAVLLGVANSEKARVTGTGLGVGITPSFVLHARATSSVSVTETFRCQLDAGGTNATYFIATEIYNAVAGTGTNLALATSFANPVGNSGVNVFAYATTAGYNIANYCEALGGNISIGLVGKSITAKNSATNVGVIGVGLNTGTSPIHVGGYFALAGSDTPTFVSAALIGDNGNTTSPVLLLRDNGTVIHEFIDGGNVGLFTSAGSYGSGTKVIFIGNCTAAPSGTPSGGGILYVESGALKFKGSSGTVSTIAVA